ncbi:MAG: hypothetical protein LAP85_23455 [Acidobacteriia bacterium]|nr:hypothetical protein [Terriglobia bacterium]
MVLGFGGKTRWGSGILLLLISWGLLTTEIHGILGHTHDEQAGPGPYRIANTTPGPHLTRLEVVQDDPFCGICLSFRLLRHSLIPTTHCIVASLYVILPINIQPITLIQTESPRDENRGPPSA